MRGRCIMVANTSDHLAWLQDKLNGYESKLSEAENTVARLRPLVSNLREVIDALTTENQGPKPQRDIFGSETAYQNDSGDIRPLRQPFVQGNQNPKMPGRRPEFADHTLIEAARTVINAALGGLHADDVTRAVFLNTDKVGFALAKHSMASELYRGAKKGFWNALGNNRYSHK